MSNEIKPAMDDFQWRQFRNAGKDQLMPRYFAQCDHASFIAKHNDALPDDDPRKITREDVEELRAADERIRGEWDHPNNPEPPTLRNLAAKLAALLPP